MAQDCRWRKAGNLRDEGEPKISAARLLPGRDSLNELVGMTGFEPATFTPSPISPSFQRIARLVIPCLHAHKHCRNTVPGRFSGFQRTPGKT